MLSRFTPRGGWLIHSSYMGTDIHLGRRRMKSTRFPSLVSRSAERAARCRSRRMRTVHPERAWASALMARVTNSARVAHFTEKQGKEREREETPRVQNCKLNFEVRISIFLERLHESRVLPSILCMRYRANISSKFCKKLALF